MLPAGKLVDGLKSIINLSSCGVHDLIVIALIVVVMAM